MSFEIVCSDECPFNSFQTNFMCSYMVNFFSRLDKLYDDMKDLVTLCIKSICKSLSEYFLEFDLYYSDIELSEKIKSYNTQQFCNNMCEEEKIVQINLKS